MTCPYCLRLLSEAQIKQIWASYCGSKPKPSMLGKKRPGVGGRPVVPTRCETCQKWCKSAAIAKKHCKTGKPAG